MLLHSYTQINATSLQKLLNASAHLKYMGHKAAVRPYIEECTFAL